jgi:type VI secretion system secreted protein Hcp
MRLTRSILLAAATLCLSTGSGAAWVGPGSEGNLPEEPNTSPIENASTLDELLDALGLDGLAVDMFLKIEGIEGESTAAGDGHEDWIVIESFGWGGSNSGSATGRSRQRGGTTFSDVSVVKTVDGASPKLYLACAQGKHFPKAEIHLVSSGDARVPYMIYELENVMITSVSVSHSAGGDVPVEEVTLNYGKIHWEYTPQDTRGPGGTVRTGWDLTANKGV